MLVVINPGAACAAADEVMGLVGGAAARERIARTIFRWPGAICFVEGQDGTATYPFAELSLAVQTAREDRKAPLVKVAEPSDEVLNKVAASIAPLANDRAIYFTGAWRKAKAPAVERLRHLLQTNHNLQAEVLPCHLEL